MRPIGIQRSAVRYPLDEIFGSAAHVRLIRVLVHDVETPLSVADAARFSGLTPAGARKALERIEKSGLVERVGSGRAQKWGPKKGQTITQALRELFAQEQRRYEDLVARLQSATTLPEIRALEAYSHSPKRVSDFLISTSSRARRLRQSAPFFAVLTPVERDRVMAAIEKRP